MNHGQTSSNVKQSSANSSEKQQSSSRDPNDSQKHEKTRIVTVKTTSIEEQNVSSLSRKNTVCRGDSWKIIKSPSPSRPVLFWEVLTTVALLIMALWMQGLPSKETHQIPDKNVWPSFEITKPQMGF
ncbi:hypothetical protein [Crocosphaera sp. Alani8]|uniref:hypothetical protein n=1 Tax=Crocosphaera sp. Alani8 TaxID=3038952 RepID=UPI00313D79BC